MGEKHILASKPTASDTAAKSRPPPHRSHVRDVAMKDSWSHGDDRRERGRVDRGVAHQRRSRSPPARRHEEPKERDHTPAISRPISRHHDRPRERSHERRRRTSRSPRRDAGEEVRERNRGRELLDTRGSVKPKRTTTHHSPSSSKRRKTRSPSPTRSHHKKSRRDPSHSPERGSVRSEKKRRPLSPLPSRKRSSERRPLDSRSEGKHKHHRDSERRKRSPSPRSSKHERPEFTRRRSVSRHSKRGRSPVGYPSKARERSLFEKAREKDRKRAQSPQTGRRSPDFDRYEPRSRSRHRSPVPHKDFKPTRARSPREKDSRPREEEERPARGDYRSEKPHPSRPRISTASGANSIEVKSSKQSPTTASGANSIEVKRKSDKMNNRGYYGGQQGYNPHQQMQAAFPLKPQYNQGPPMDPRQYSQSPQHHMTPNSYHGSPQAQSPYSGGRGGWGGPQYSPQPQYPPNPQSYQQQHQGSNNYSNNQGGPQGSYYNNHSQSPPYQQMAPNGPMNQPYQQNFRGNQRGYRGNHYNGGMRGGRGEFRGGRGGHFQNLHWNAGGAGRGNHNNSGPATPQHASPQQQQHPSNSGPPQAAAPQTASQPDPQPEDEEDNEDLFRPSKELRVEEKGADKKDTEEKATSNKTTPTGPQSQPSKFSFAFKATTKTPATPKPEISQKLTVAPPRKEVQSPERTRLPPPPPPSRPVPTEPAVSRRPEFREPPPPPPPTTRKVKKIMKRQKARPQLTDDFKKSDSVYYRKPGNESVVGSGTYGKVFKGIHVYTKDMVALKKIRMEGERDGFPVTAVREIKLLQSLKHRNIVNLREVMVEKNDCFMVFEYLSHDLTGLLNHPTFKLDPAHKKDLAKQMFEGLDYLHRRGVLHRDIKAANILVSNQGQLKIADFGLARFYAKRRQLDYTNRVITIWYRSPELLLGETQYGPAVDIWSAACVLVEIFTRHAIFPGDGGEISQLEKIYAILGTPNRADWPGLVDMAWYELLRPSAKRPNVFAEKYRDRVTPAAYDLLEAMFQYDPVKRPSASDVLEHPYFTAEEPKPRQAIELSKLEGDWHEFESKALRKKNEQRDKEARRSQKEAKEATMKAEKDKKRAPEGEAAEREAKRVQMAPPSVPITKQAEALK
ncbi:hypothetical protein HYALB_00005040 [Hymenoscyphus albidus]|uniref:cyclin-dependent kinase n=1 Tax=Hymenoscyphus albidus TaxID=595503 RepID=A0A9N9Q910_9HELO|nr:hypothetical protein HYALB_00005040 [Hymenoscyphus albidus]